MALRGKNFILEQPREERAPLPRPDSPTSIHYSVGKDVDLGQN